MQIGAGETRLTGAAGRCSARFGAARGHPVCSLPIVDFGEQPGVAPAGDTDFIVVVLPIADANGR